VIAARIGGLEDIVRDGETGYLVPSVDPEALTDAMLRLARDPALARRMGEAGRARMLERFPEERCTDRTEMLYRSWLDGRRSNGSLVTAAAASSISRKSHGTR
jgi:glycosyltransferase involved in cell wall biosynthesis